MHESLWILRTGEFSQVNDVPQGFGTQVHIQVSSGETFVNPARMVYIYTVFLFLFQKENFKFELLKPDELLQPEGKNLALQH